VNAGGTMGGVTAASAIAALQEAGSKTSRDMLAGSYRAMVQMWAVSVSVSRGRNSRPSTPSSI